MLNNTKGALNDLNRKTHTSNLKEIGTFSKDNINRKHKINLRLYIKQQQMCVGSEPF